MLRKALQIIMGTSSQPMASSSQMSSHKREARRKELIKQESAIGATLFGKIPEGHQREFFCLDEYTWIWHESWIDEVTKATKTMHVRYEFQPRGVLKIVDGIATGFVAGDELKYLLQSMTTYYKRVSKEVYGVAPTPIQFA